MLFQELIYILEWCSLILFEMGTNLCIDRMLLPFLDKFVYFALYKAGVTIVTFLLFLVCCISVISFV